MNWMLFLRWCQANEFQWARSLQRDALSKDVKLTIIKKLWKPNKMTFGESVWSFFLIGSSGGCDGCWKREREFSVIFHRYGASTPPFMAVELFPSKLPPFLRLSNFSVSFFNDFFPCLSFFHMFNSIPWKSFQIKWGGKSTEMWMRLVIWCSLRFDD